MPLPANAYVPQSVAPRQNSLRRAVVVWSFIAAMTLAFVSLILIAPFALARGHVSLAQAIYSLFSYLCHQMPERSLDFDGHKFAVCSRCTGIYVGFALGVMFYPLVRSLRRTDAPPLIWLFAAVLPITIDFALGFFGVWANTHLSRFTTGALFGAVAAIYVVAGALDLTQARSPSSTAANARPSFKPFL